MKAPQILKTPKGSTARTVAIDNRKELAQTLREFKIVTKRMLKLKGVSQRYLIREIQEVARSM